jgi:hypothetical protein
MDLKERKQQIAKKQLEFCNDLMWKLHENFYHNKDKNPFYSWDFIANKTQMKNDIKRLRRELLDLYKMFEER